MINTTTSSFTYPTYKAASSPPVQFGGKAKKLAKKAAKKQLRKFGPTRLLLEIRDFLKGRRGFF